MPGRTTRKYAYPPLALICVDAAHAVWAVPAQHLDNRSVAGRLVGHVRRTQAAWAYETDTAGRSRQLYPTPRDAARALLDELGGPLQEAAA